MLLLFPRALPIGRTTLSASKRMTAANVTRKLLKRWSHYLPQEISWHPVQPSLTIYIYKYLSHGSQAGNHSLWKQLPQPWPDHPELASGAPEESSPSKVTVQSTFLEVKFVGKLIYVMEGEVDFMLWEFGITGADLFGEHSECIVVSPTEISGSLGNTYLCPSMYLLHGSDLMKKISLKWFPRVPDWYTLWDHAGYHLILGLKRKENINMNGECTGLLYL